MQQNNRTMDLNIQLVHRRYLWQKYKYYQRGFSALELMMVLAVILTAIVATVMTMGGNTNKNNSNIMVTDVSTLVQNIRAAYASSSDEYSTLTTAAAISMDLIPGDLRVNQGSGIIYNQFQGGTVTLVGGTDNDNFVITYTDVPSAVCNTVVTTLGGSLFSDININGTDVFNTDTLPTMSPVTVGTACTSSNNQATIEFTSS